MTRPESERIAILETQMTAVLRQNEETNELLKKILEKQTRMDEAFATSRGWRLGFLTALTAGSGGAGAAIMKWLGSGGPTGTH